MQFRLVRWNWSLIWKLQCDDYKSNWVINAILKFIYDLRPQRFIDLIEVSQKYIMILRLYYIKKRPDVCD